MFVATIKVTVPFPFPGPALMTATHATLLSASHRHVGSAVTVLLPEPPSAVNERLVGEIDVVQTTGAACVTAKLVPAIKTVPVRAFGPGLAVTLNTTLPGPEPVLPDVMVIHAALLLAAHGHPPPVVTVLLPVPASPPKPKLVGEML